MTILASKDSTIVSGGAANETIKAYFNPVRQVLKYAFKTITAIGYFSQPLILVALADHQKSIRILLRLN